MLLSETRSSASSHPSVCGFIDDDRNKRGMTVNGVLVSGGGEDLARLVRAHRAGGSDRHPFGDRRANDPHHPALPASRPSFRTMPAIAEIVSRRAMASQIRDVAVEDLLGREPVELDRRRIGEKLRGGAALVTGAAGSIGSELCRQIAGFRPAALVAFDSSETGLFHLEREIRERFPGVAFHAEIGNIQNRQRLREVYSPGALPGGLPRGGLQARAHDGVARVRGRGKQRRWGVQRGLHRGGIRRRGLRHDLFRQGRPPHQYHGRHQTGLGA